MAQTDAEVIEMGAKYLLSLLAEKTSIRYSYFFDGSEETAQKLADAIGLSEDERAWYCAEAIMDYAVEQLATQQIVFYQGLNEKLADGKNDYVVTLTPRGKAACVQNEKLRFWDV